MTALKKQIPALAGGLILAGCGDGNMQGDQLLSDAMVEAIEAFCIQATHCEGFGYEADGCMAAYQAYFSAVALVYGWSADCEAAHVSYYTCSAETDCEGEGDRCDDERLALSEICWPDSD